MNFKKYVSTLVVGAMVFTSGGVIANAQTNTTNKATTVSTQANGSITVLDKTGKATHDVYVRDNSNTKGKILGTLNKNKTIKLNGKTKDGWYKVDYNGKVGYVYSSYIKIDATSDNNSNNNNSDITVLDKTGKATHSVYIRDNSNTKGKILGTLNKDKTIKLNGKTKDGWYKVDYNGKVGYVYSSYVKIVETSDNNSNNNNSDITVLDKTGKATHNVYIRDNSNTKGKILGTLNKDKTIKLNGKTKDGWYKVDYNGKVGYVYSSYVKIVETSDNNSNTTVLDKTGKATHDVYIRNNSNTKGKILGTLNKNKTIKIKEKTKDGWYKVDYNGKVGYVYSSYVKIVG